MLLKRLWSERIAITKIEMWQKTELDYHADYNSARQRCIKFKSQFMAQKYSLLIYLLWCTYHAVGIDTA
jgi:hypothetical protein